MLTVGDIRKAIKNLDDDAEVTLDFGSNCDRVLEMAENFVLERAHKGFLGVGLVLDVQDYNPDEGDGLVLGDEMDLEDEGRD